MSSQVLKRNSAPTNWRVWLEIHRTNTFTAHLTLAEERIPIDSFNVSFVRSRAGYTPSTLVGRRSIGKVECMSLHDPSTPV